MKINFKIAGLIPVFSACVDFSSTDPSVEIGEFGLPAEVDRCPGCLEEQELRGELMLFFNARLTNDSYTANVPIDDQGRYIGPAIYVYDPKRVCSQANDNKCRLARVGNLWLDEQLGEISLEDRSLKRFTLRELAWHPQQGLWAISYDTLNDEWGLARLDVSDWTKSDNRIGVDRYTFRYGYVEDPATDPCYWRESLTGLAFLQDKLYVGAAGKPGNGLDAQGQVFSVDEQFLTDPKHCLHPSDVSQDPKYYACNRVCSVWSEFPENLGIAGDVEASIQAQELVGIVRSEDQNDDSYAKNLLYAIPASGNAPSMEPLPIGPTIEGISVGEDIDGLARIDGVLYGINTRGKIYRFTEPSPETPSVWDVNVHDDLGPLFEDLQNGLRIRGATKIIIPDEP